MKKMISLLLCLLMLAALPISANAFRIQHNIAALNSYRNLTNNISMLTKHLEKLSNGYRINRAGDDTANPSMTEKMRAQIAALDKTGTQSAANENSVFTHICDLLNVESDWNYLDEARNVAPDPGRSTPIQEDFGEKSIGYYVNGENEQVPDQIGGWKSIEEKVSQFKMQLFSGLYGQNNTPEGIFAGVNTPNGVNGIGYEADAKGKLNASYQIVLTEDQQIIVNDNPQIGLVSTRGVVTFYEAGTVNIGVFDEDGNAVDSFSIQVNEDGTLETPSYANRLTLQLGDTGSFGMSFSEKQDTVPDMQTELRPAAQVKEYARNNTLTAAANAMLGQANQVPQGVLQMLQ